MQRSRSLAVSLARPVGLLVAAVLLILVLLPAVVTALAASAFQSAGS
jgi:hypothetical protein